MLSQQLIKELSGAIYANKTITNKQTMLAHLEESRFISFLQKHFGGLLDAGVKSAKQPLLRNFTTVYLTYEELNRVVIRIEDNIN